MKSAECRMRSHRDSTLGTRRRCVGRRPSVAYALLTLITTLALPGCNVRDAMTTDVEIVARAGDHLLTVDELADLVARSPAILLSRGGMSRWAQAWIDYSLFAQRLAAGDSLLDTLSVTAAMWYDIDSMTVNRYSERLADSLVRLGDTTVDSAFGAGTHRLIDLVLVQTTSDMPTDELEARLRAVNGLQARLAAGVPWNQVMRGIGNPEAGVITGRMLTVRAALPPELGAAVYALEPGAATRVVEASNGFYIARRPTLAESRADFTSSLRDTLMQRMQRDYVEALPDRWNVSIRRRAPALMREAARYPYETSTSRKVLGTFNGGVFTVADFVRWLPVTGVQSQIPTVGDEQLREVASSLIEAELLYLEAQRAGVTPDLDGLAQLKQRLAERISEIKEALNLDVLLSSGANPDVQRRMIQLGLAEHFRQVVAGEQSLALVPPFLAHKLRDEAGWGVSFAAVDRAVERARIGRAQLARSGQLPGAAIRPPLPAARRGGGGGDR